ncbi:hypothetical protein RB195_003697 [Necator americanus]|uniref:C2H2-type domain-containing protein n=1 Tax=Necator americanus TaxID=51031 RepID=A0ABR1DPZ0_NECAM
MDMQLQVTLQAQCRSCDFTRNHMSTGEMQLHLKLQIHIEVYKNCNFIKSSISTSELRICPELKVHLEMATSDEVAKPVRIATPYGAPRLQKELQLHLELQIHIGVAISPETRRCKTSERPQLHMKLQFQLIQQLHPELHVHPGVATSFGVACPPRCCKHIQTCMKFYSKSMFRVGGAGPLRFQKVHTTCAAFDA